MIGIILYFILGYILGIILFGPALRSAAQKDSELQVVPKCPPHQWSWKKVYNDDGSLHHEHLVCAKCGPLRGESNEK